MPRQKTGGVSPGRARARPYRKTANPRFKSSTEQQTPHEQEPQELEVQQILEIDEPSEAVPQPAQGTSDETIPSLASAGINMGNIIEHTNCPESVASVADSLGANISQAQRVKVLNGEYVDLSIFLEKPQDPDRVEKRLAMIEGNLVALPKNAKSNILNIDKWTDAFLAFTAVYLTAHPAEAQGLLKYMHTVRLGASRYPGLGFKSYDEQFRLKKSKNLALPWGSIDAELWLIYMSSQHAGFSPNVNVGASIGTGRTMKCFDYNYKGSCFKNPCMYQHICLKCNGKHASCMCYANNFQRLGTNSFRNQAPNRYRFNNRPSNPAQTGYFNRFGAPRQNPN